MATGASSQQNDTFTCWKEIAAYLGKGVRTVQRWEANFGLPVRRPNANSRSIHVSREELDHWLATRWKYKPRKFVSAQPSNGVQATKVHVNEHQKLRGHCRQLVDQLHRNLLLLTEVCNTLVHETALSRILQSQPVFPSSSRQSAVAPPPRRKARRPF